MTERNFLQIITDRPPLYRQHGIEGENFALPDAPPHPLTCIQHKKFAKEEATNRFGKVLGCFSTNFIIFEIFSVTIT